MIKNKYIIILTLILILILIILSIYLNRKNTNIYLLPPSYYSNNIYGDDFINILNKYGNIIYINYPKNVFDIDKFTDSISQRINNSSKNNILVGWSFGTLISNLIASKCNNLKGMLCISYSCNGQVTEIAKNIGIKISKSQNMHNKIKYINTLMFSDNYKPTNYILNQLKINMLSDKSQNNLGISIGKWINKHPNGICKIYNIPVFIIYGQDDIVYKLSNKDICNNYNCTVIMNGGHGILLSHNNIVLKWLNNSLNHILK